MKTSRKPLGWEGVSFLEHSKNGQQSLRVDDDGRSGRSKDATSDENVKVVHTLVMCDTR